MLGKTHRAGGTFAMLMTFTILKQKGMLLPEVNDFVQLAIMYPICSWGSIFSDLDHGADSIPDKDPVSVVINKFLRLTGAKHRSWQTHSLLVTGGFLFLLFALTNLGTTYLQNQLDWVVIRLLVMGFSVGVLSHLILDALSTAGVHIWPGFKLRFVPKSSAFATGGKWETMVFWVLIIGIALLIINLVTMGFGINLIDLISELILGGFKS